MLDYITSIFIIFKKNIAENSMREGMVKTGKFIGKGVAFFETTRRKLEGGLQTRKKDGEGEGVKM
jgi:hypothetical protein